MLRDLSALPRTGVQVPLAQAVVAAGGVEDIGLELGADGLIAGEGHGERVGRTWMFIASHRENWETAAGNMQKYM